MGETDVRIIELENFNMVSALGFGTSPEIEAWNKFLNWAGLKGLLEDLGNRRFFGFNNPDPSAGTQFFDS